MRTENCSPSLLLKEFFSENGLIFKQTEEKRDGQRFVAGEVYNPRDSQTEKAKQFLFKKFGEDKVRWNHVCSIRSERFYMHSGQVIISVCGAANLALVEKLAQELKRTLRQECMIELRSDEKIYCDSRQYESEQAADRKYLDTVFWTRVVALLVVVLLGSKLLADILPLPSLSLLPGMPTWESLAVTYWIIRLLMLFFAGV